METIQRTGIVFQAADQSTIGVALNDECPYCGETLHTGRGCFCPKCKAGTEGSRDIDVTTCRADYLEAVSFYAGLGWKVLE
jgi:hypothetical protein